MIPLSLYLRIRVSGPDPSRHAPLQLGALRTGPDGAVEASRLWRLQIPEFYAVPDEEWLPGILGGPEDPCGPAGVGARPEHAALEELLEFAEGCEYVVAHHLRRELVSLEAMARRQALALPLWFHAEGVWGLREAQWAQDDGFLPPVENLGLEALRVALLPPREGPGTARTDVHDLWSLRRVFEEQVLVARRAAAARRSASSQEEARQRARDEAELRKPAAVDAVMMAAFASGQIGASMQLGTWQRAPPPAFVSEAFRDDLWAWSARWLGRSKPVAPEALAVSAAPAASAAQKDTAEELDDAFFR